jgi:hypothetical protein
MLQVTLVLLLPVTVAVNVVDWLANTDTVEGDTLTWTIWGVVVVFELLPHAAKTTKGTTATTNESTFMPVLL